MFVCVCVQDSLAAEIEGTMRRELSVEEESTFQDQRSETFTELSKNQNLMKRIVLLLRLKIPQLYVPTYPNRLIG